MMLVLTVIAFSGLLEFMVWLPFFRRLRTPLTWFIIIVLAVMSGLLLGIYPSVWAALVLFLSLYRMLGLLRITERRIETSYLLWAGLKTGIILCAAQLVVVGELGFVAFWNITLPPTITIICCVQLLFALMIAASTLRHYRTTKPPVIDGALADHDLPTLSVGIPARNETDDLSACLQSLLASNYPKLEILVLDDCSQQRQTAEIIKGFAHDGVRFVAGAVPPDRWLAKNFAYQQLLDAASGDLMLFAGVDVRFQPDTLRTLVLAMLQKKKSMFSVIPRNQVPGQSLQAAVVQPSRYAWELSLPRRLVNRPPVLSNCWLITRELLIASGTFEAIARSISPESYFARKATHTDDGYSFIRSDDQIGLVSVKTLEEQRSTAIRVRYPQLHRRPELVALLTLAEAGVLIMPFILLIASILTRNRQSMVLTGLSCLLLVSFYAGISYITYQKFLWRSLWIEPFAAIYDAALLNYSMWRYEFSDVIWKDRNVCIPVMRTYPNLPKV